MSKSLKKVFYSIAPEIKPHSKTASLSSLKSQGNIFQSVRTVITTSPSNLHKV